MRRRPGDRLRAFAAGWCSPDTMARLIDPVIADLRHEHAEAVSGGRVWKSRLIHAAAWLAFLKVLIICAFSSRDRTAADRTALKRAAAFASILTLAVMMLLELPFISSYPRVLTTVSPMRFVYLAPQAFPMALTIGTTLGIVFGLGGSAFSRRAGPSVLAFVLMASAISFVNLAWVTPAANQEFRSLMGGGQADPGIAEFSLGQLAREIDVFNHDPAFSRFGYLLALLFSYHSRLALAFSPVLFAFFALSISSDGLLRRWTLGIGACVAFLGYYMLLNGGSSWVWNLTLPAVAAAWLPNLVIAVGAAAIWATRVRQTILAR
jgi:lipopolysaccharide export LptBFGC system permease protein LptF